METNTTTTTDARDFKSVRVQITWETGDIQNAAFDTCEAAWLFANKTILAARNRRAKTDRVQAWKAIYFGVCKTGVVFGGNAMPGVHGEFAKGKTPTVAAVSLLEEAEYRARELRYEARKAGWMNPDATYNP